MNFRGKGEMHQTQGLQIVFDSFWVMHLYEGGIIYEEIRKKIIRNFIGSIYGSYHSISDAGLCSRREWL